MALMLPSPGLLPSHVGHVLCLILIFLEAGTRHRRGKREPLLNIFQGAMTDNNPSSWLYMLILAMDTNFRLRSKLRGLIKDPTLSPGWSYFVDYVPYSKFIASYVDQVEVSILFFSLTLWIYLIAI